ncbi:MAG: very short patch repair endonuclease [Oscillospiraceae bacterium]|nr:very short patch repair endonuclease [Oscillospiraceae bacterium]
MAKYPFITDMKRRKTMSRIKNKDTSIEIILRRALWHSGIRYRKNFSRLPGAPDIAIPKYCIAIFCDGEFWHGKDWDAKKHKIHSNREYWLPKIERNISRDNEINMVLSNMGWTVIRFWGSDIRDNLGCCVDEIKNAVLQNKIDMYYMNYDVNFKIGVPK